MPTVKAAVEEVSGQLNDQENGFEYTRWTRPKLINYVSDGLGQVGLYRPDAFTSNMQVTLVPGVRQELPAGATSLVSIPDNNDSDNPQAVTRNDNGLVRAFNKKQCHYDFDAQGNVVYRVSAYSYDARNPGLFFVSPPVPNCLSTPPTITICVATPAPTLDLTWWLKDLPIDNKYYNAVIAWALSRAYELDIESETQFRNMNYQRAEFYKMMGVKYSMESKFNSGWFLGQRGTENTVRGS